MRTQQIDSHLQALESGPQEKVRVRIPRLLSKNNRVYRDKDIIQGIHNDFFFRESEHHVPVPHEFGEW